VKRTLKRRSKVLETVKRETDGASNYPMGMQIIHFFVVFHSYLARVLSALLSGC
jgi:hypothetical protein